MIMKKKEEEEIKYEDFIKVIKLFRIIKIIIIIINIYFISISLNKDNFRTQILRKARKFMNLCLEQKLNNNFNKTNNMDNPKISVIIPVYNCQNSIKITINSIQNQNISDFELILVNDFSKDNSLKIIEKLSQQDKRIKIINNNKNMGTLYSRSIGTLKAKGKYILPLDNDDLFMDEDIFDFAFNESEKGNYDILGFHAIRGPNYKPRLSDMIDDIYHDNPNNLILVQPELGVHSVTKNGKYDINNIHIWGKCIKTDIYKKAINSLGKIKYSYFVSWAEDTSMVFILFNIAKSYKFISKYGVFHLMSKNTACYTQSNANKLFGEIFFLDTLFDFSKNDFKNKKYAVLKALEIKNEDIFKEGFNNTRNQNFFKYVLKKITNSKYITKEDKNIIINNYTFLNLF